MNRVSPLVSCLLTVSRHGEASRDTSLYPGGRSVGGRCSGGEVNEIMCPAASLSSTGKYDAFHSHRSLLDRPLLFPVLVVSGRGRSGLGCGNRGIRDVYRVPDARHEGLAGK